MIGYLHALTGEVERWKKRVVMVLDNAPFHKAGAVRDRRPGWEAQDVRPYCPPAYCPHVDLIQGVWRRPEGFLKPCRFYGSLTDRAKAVHSKCLQPIRG
jgi:hypothetical protein